MAILRFLLSSAILASSVSTRLAAQPAPTVYTVTEVNSMLGVPVTMTIYRNGSKAVIDNRSDPGAANPKGTHVRAIYDLPAHKTYSWDLITPGGGCGSATFSGDWGDPFVLPDEVSGDKARQTGTETLNGFAAKILEASIDGGKVKAWVDTKTGLVIKAQLIAANQAPQVVLEVKQFSAAPPPASLFVLPPSCAAAANAPHVPTEQERIAAETGGNAADFANAIYGPGSKASCTVLFRVVQAGSMKPVTGGFQVALDRTVDVNHPAHYVYGVGNDGTYTFSGGGLREVTSQLHNGILRIENVPAQFNLEVHYGKSGGGGGLMYRQCSLPETVLLYVMKDDGGDWLWVKSGKYATVEAPR